MLGSFYYGAIHNAGITSLARRLRHGDPVARRVKLTRGDAARSLLAALRWLA